MYLWGFVSSGVCWRANKVEGTVNWCLRNNEILASKHDTTSSSGRFSLALEVGREKALASAGHMTTKHPEFVGVLN